MSGSGQRPAWQRVVATETDYVPREPAAPVYDIPDDRAHDAREQIEWFQKLPEHAKDDIRDAWCRQDGEHRLQKERRRHTSKVYVWEAAAAFVLLEFVLMSPSFMNLIVALLFGAAAGALTALFRSSAGSYCLVFTTFYIAFGLTGGSQHIFYYVLGGIIVACVGAALGRVHTLQRFDGTEL